MRRWLPLLLLLPAFPLGLAQAESAMGEDPAGDVQSNMGLPPSPGVAEIDLRSFMLVEDAAAFHFTVQVEKIESESEPDMLASAFGVTFTHGDSRFQAYMMRSNLLGTGDFMGQIRIFDEGFGRYVNIGATEVTPDFAGNAVTMHVPREYLRDESGAAPHPGRTLTDFAVSSYGDRIMEGTFINFSGEEVSLPHYEDRLPDTGVLDAVHEVVYGVTSSGHLSFRSPEPFRASNGEATTFIFDVVAINDGDAEDRVHFEATRFPAQWEVTLPPDMTLDAQSAVEVPVIVRTAFAHSHGGTESFILSMKSGNDAAAVGRIEIGVHYPLIPQPAGHHDTLWLHSIDHSDEPVSFVLATALSTALSQTGLLQDVYMNALEEDERADETPSEGRKCSLMIGDADYPVGTGYCWDIPLEPGLQLGLDFDVTRNGSLTVTIESMAPMPAVSLQGELLYYAPPEEPDTGGPPFFFRRETTVLATIERSDPVDLLTGGSHTFEVDVVPAPEADYIAYKRGAAMELQIRVNTLRPDTWIYGPALPAPTMAGGASMRLPLNEYADPVGELVSLKDDGLRVRALTQQEKPVNPGKTVVFQASVENRGNATDVGVGIIGSHRDWVRLLTPAELRLTQGANATVAIAVTPPAGSSHGDSADLVLQFANLKDITNRSLLRFVATVDTEQELEDESALADQLANDVGKRSPAPALWLAPLAVLWLRRR